MKKQFLLLLVSLCWMQLAVAQYQSPQKFDYSASPEEAGFDASRLALIDSVYKAYVKTNQLPNAILFIVRHGKVAYFKNYGWKNIEKKEAIKKDDIFRIASHTKSITSVAVMQLFEQGKFFLDDPISKFIPEFKNPRVIIDPKDTSHSTRPAKSEITIRHLLSHSSGINYGNFSFSKNNVPAVNSLDKVTTGEIVRKIAQAPLDHDPGERFTYGMSTDVLGYLVEVVSDMSLDQYFKKNIFEPLGMKDSYFYLPSDKASRLVTIYSPDSTGKGGPMYPSNHIQNQTYPVAGAKTYFTGGAGIVSTIEDNAKFCQMLLNGGVFNGKRIIGRKSIDMMTMNQIKDSEVWDTQNKFGLGFELLGERSVSTLSGSVGAFKWGGLYSSDYIVDPKEDMILLFYTNTMPFIGEPGKRFRTLVYQALKAK